MRQDLTHEQLLNAANKAAGCYQTYLEQKANSRIYGAYDKQRYALILKATKQNYLNALAAGGFLNITAALRFRRENKAVKK